MEQMIQPSGSALQHDRPQLPKQTAARIIISTRWQSDQRFAGYRQPITRSDICRLGVGQSVEFGIRPAEPQNRKSYSS
jgi:hypothetical protein